MVLFGIVFGIIDMILMALLLFGLLIGSSLTNRHSSVSVLWTAVIVVGVLYALWNWSSWTFAGIFDFITSVGFLKGLLIYLGAGVLYSVLEFILMVRRAVKRHTIAWKNFMSDTLRFNGFGPEVPPELVNYIDLQSTGANFVHAPRNLLWKHLSREKQVEMLREMVRSANMSARFRLEDKVVSLRVKGEDDPANNSELGVEPRIDKEELAFFAAHWTLFWPAFAVGLLLGDFVTEVFNQLANLIARLSTGVVRRMYQNVFKI